MKECFLLSFLICCALAPATNLVSQKDKIPVYDDDSGYEVYSAILPFHYSDRTTRPSSIVIRQETVRSFGAFVDMGSATTTCLRPEREFENIVGPAIADYLRVNKTRWCLKDRLKLTIPYQLIPFESLHSFIQKEGWDAFHKKHPESRGFIDLSAVGFNPDKTVAVVSVGKWCGDLCGEGYYYVLQKKEGKWIPLDWKGQKCSWIS